MEIIQHHQGDLDYILDYLILTLTFLDFNILEIMEFTSHHFTINKSVKRTYYKLVIVFLHFCLRILVKHIHLESYKNLVITSQSWG